MAWALRTRALVRAPIPLYRNGFGWLADPHCFVSIGRRRHVAAEATLLGDDESARVLERYRQAHPRAWARLRAAIEHAVRHPVTGLPMVRLTLHDIPHPH